VIHYILTVHNHIYLHLYLPTDLLACIYIYLFMCYISLSNSGDLNMSSPLPNIAGEDNRTQELMLHQ